MGHVEVASPNEVIRVQLVPGGREGKEGSKVKRGGKESGRKGKRVAVLLSQQSVGLLVFDLEPEALTH